LGFIVGTKGWGFIHMSRKMCIAALVVAVGCVGSMSVLATQASAITLPYAFNNWAVWGYLTPKKLNEPVVLPKGSTFNGVSELTSTPTELFGTVKGNIYVPPFNTSLKLAGVVPTTVGVTFTEVGESEGTLTEAPATDCTSTRFGGQCMNLHVTSKADIGITETGLLGIDVPTKCETSEPVVFSLDTTLPLSQLLDAGPSFTGTTTIPSIKCGGLSGVALGVLLTGLMSGPENPYELNLGPHEPAPPTIVTGEASSVSQISAELHATVEPNGEPESECYFEYGTSTSYGTSVPCARQYQKGFAVYAPVAGLSEGTPYHFRIVASNPLGTSYGADQTFTTLNGSPEYGQCVAQKDGSYSEGSCRTVAEKKGVPDHKGSYEWVPGPASTCVSKKKGDYTDSSCTTKSAKAHKGSYEKAPGPGDTSSTETVTLQVLGLERTVVCASSNATGEVTGLSTGTQRITLTGCEASAKKCTSEGPNSTASGKTGVIITNLLDTRLLGPVGGQVWTELSSAEHEPYSAEFNCEGLLFRTKGSLAGIQSGNIDMSSLTSTTTFALEEGEQAIATETSENAGKSWSSPTASNLITTTTNTAAAATEIRP
jgi:hypothetical protein